MGKERGGGRGSGSPRNEPPFQNLGSAPDLRAFKSFSRFLFWPDDLPGRPTNSVKESSECSKH